MWQVARSCSFTNILAKAYHETGSSPFGSTANWKKFILIIIGHQARILGGGGKVSKKPPLARKTPCFLFGSENLRRVLVKTNKKTIIFKNSPRKLTNELGNCRKSVAHHALHRRQGHDEQPRRRTMRWPGRLQRRA